MENISYDYSESTVVITGGSSGIGREIALQFGDAGATVINADIRDSPKDIGETVPTHEEIGARGGGAVYVETDVSDPEQIESLVEGAREFGGVDVMINNAALLLEKPFTKVTFDEFERLHSVNVRGVFFGCQAAVNDMHEREEPGTIINTASISSDLAQPHLTAYESTKGAIKMITRGTALDSAEYGIRVNAIAPGSIATEFAPGVTEETERGAKNDEFIKPIPLDRAGYPEDIAGAALFLASDAASYITGELLHVDGGWQIC